jgi:hypothetical protein
MWTTENLANIEYHGQSSLTRPCLDAIASILHFGTPVVSARLLTASNAHAFLLSVRESDLIGIKAGFSSGYMGEGPKGLASALELLDYFGADIDEHEVSPALLKRLDSSRLLQSDLENILNAQPLRPQRWRDYIYSIRKETRPHPSRIIGKFPLVIPFGLIDPRILDLARGFPADPDAALMTGYRRLEHRIRERCGLTEVSAAKLFGQAFQGPNATLTWQDANHTEISGRFNLFVGTYMAFRNRRAHKEVPIPYGEVLHEFLILNRLFVLEAAAVERTDDG